MNFRWTDAGRAALASAAHVGTAAVRLTHLALGDGRGPGGAADDNRAALRNERHRAAIAGTPAAAGGRIALRADFAPDASYGVTEAGIFGTAGDPPGAETLLLYWTADGAEAAKAGPGLALAIASVIEFQNAAAEVAVTVGGNIVFGATDPASEEAFGSTRYATGEETGDKTRADRSVTPKGLHEGAGKVLATLLGSAPGDGKVYQLKGKADGTIAVEERTQDGATAAQIAANAAAIAGLGGRVTAVEGKTGDATTARRGIVELATQAETETGTDEARAVTPKGLEAALPKLIGGLKDTAPDAGQKLILEGVAGGGVKVVLAPFETLLEETFAEAVPVGAVAINGVSTISIPASGDYLLAMQAGGITGQAFRSSGRLECRRNGSETLLAAYKRYLGGGQYLAVDGVEFSQALSAGDKLGFRLTQGSGNTRLSGASFYIRKA